jgi:hypothetical protein
MVDDMQYFVNMHENHLKMYKTTSALVSTVS